MSAEILFDRSNDRRDKGYDSDIAVYARQALEEHGLRGGRKKRIGIPIHQWYPT